MCTWNCSWCHWKYAVEETVCWFVDDVDAFSTSDEGFNVQASGHKFVTLASQVEHQVLFLEGDLLGFCKYCRFIANIWEVYTSQITL